ncbi:hypothetical protein GCM10027271_23040 [Saccharopolyspora gloriosae]
MPADRAEPRTTPAGSASSVSARSPARSSARSAAVTTARCSSPARVAADSATSSGSGSAESTKDSSRRACSRSASPDFADSATGTAPAGTTGAASTGSGSGACSMMVCALVPLMPNEEIPARRGRSDSGHDVCSVSSRTAPEFQSTCEEGSSTCSVFGSSPWRIASTILMTPATPAAAWVWLMLDFTDPSHSGRSASRSLP